MSHENQIFLLGEIHTLKINRNNYPYNHQLINQEKTWCSNRDLLFFNLIFTMIEISSAIALIKLIELEEKSFVYIIPTLILLIVSWYSQSKLMAHYVYQYFSQYELIESKDSIIEAYTNQQINDAYLNLSVHKSQENDQRASAQGYQAKKSIKLRALDSRLEMADFQDILDCNIHGNLIVCQSTVSFTFLNEHDSKQVETIIQDYKRQHQAKLNTFSKVVISYCINGDCNGAKNYCTDKRKIQNLKRFGYAMSYLLLIFPFLIAVHCYMVKKFNKRIVKNVRVEY